MSRCATNFGEFGNVGLHCFFFPKRVKRLLEDLRCSAVRRHDYAVVHPFAFAPRGNNTGITQVRKMPRYLGLRRVENLDKKADTDFAIAHQVQQAQPGRVTECLKEAGKIELGFCSHKDIFALTNTIVKHIVVLANML